MELNRSVECTTETFIFLPGYGTRSITGLNQKYYLGNKESVHIFLHNMERVPY